MQAKRLADLIGSDGYIVAYYKVSDGKDYVGIGNRYIHDLIHIDFESLNFYTKLTPNKTLGLILKRLENLVYSGLLREILEKNEIGQEFNLPVFYEKDGYIKETLCAGYGWPNTTIEGFLMHDNVYFKSKVECAKRAYGTEESREINLNQLRYMVKEKEKELEEFRGYLDKELSRIERLKGIVEGIS